MAAEVAHHGSTDDAKSRNDEDAAKVPAVEMDTISTNSTYTAAAVSSYSGVSKCDPVLTSDYEIDNNSFQLNGKS